MPEQDLLDNLGAILQGGKVVLVLGPEAHLLEQMDESNLPSFLDIVVANSDELKTRKVNLSEGFFYPSGGTYEDWFNEKVDIHKAIIKYCKGLGIPAFYEYLASLPFSMVVSLSPDDLMPRVMEKLGLGYDFVYYKKTNGSSQLKLYQQTKVQAGKRFFKNSKGLERSSDADHPLIFNFLGYYDDKDSLLYTYDSLFEFMYDVFPISNIPDDIKNAIVNADTYLFIGFGYKYWYLKIIFFLFNKIRIEHNIDFKIQAIFNFAEEQNAVVQVYQQLFKMQFFKMSTPAFSNALFSHCSKEDTLRQRVVNEGPVRLLFVASLPNGKMPIRPDKDWARIKEVLKLPIGLKSLEVEEVMCSKAEDLLFHLNKYRPHIMIISAHGSQKGLFFETESNDEAVELTGEALLEKVNAHRLIPGNQLQIVLLGACHSAIHADRIAVSVEHTIGMKGPVHDEAVRIFTEEFLRTYDLQRDVPSSVAAGQSRLASDPQYHVDRDLIHYVPRVATAGLSAVTDRG